MTLLTKVSSFASAPGPAILPLVTGTICAVAATEMALRALADFAKMFTHLLMKTEGTTSVLISEELFSMDSALPT